MSWTDDKEIARLESLVDSVKAANDENYRRRVKAEAERDQLREMLRKADLNIVADLYDERDRYRAALEEIAALDGGYPDDYCAIARAALDPTEAPRLVEQDDAVYSRDDGTLPRMMQPEWKPEA